MKTADNTRNVEFRVRTGDRIGKDITHSQVNRLLVKIMCKDDETGGEAWSLVQNRDERGNNTRRRNLASSLHP